MGGGKRLINVTTLLVPVMGVAYIAVALVITFMNVKLLPDIFSRIFTESFDAKAIFGGFSGSCIMYGIKRGLFSNEAGVGSAPNASASADVKHPVNQGLVQILSVFIDTILVCTATAFMCMSSGVEPTEKLSGAPYVQKALYETLGNAGPVFITVAMVLFAFTTLLGNLYYVDRSLHYMLKRTPTKTEETISHIIASLVIFLGSGLSASLLWDIADVTMGAMTLINMPVILYLGKYSVRALSDYDKQRKQKKEPVFYAKNIDLPHDVDYWK
jgi:AGCS family alanine or glycine:cation symporter